MKKINIDAFYSLLSQLIRFPSVVGSEHAFYRTLQRELEERGAKVTWYEGVLVAQGHAPNSAMFTAHCDRHGLICTGPNEFQYAAFIAGSRSDLLGNSVSEQLMREIEGRFRNVPVYAYEPWSGAYLGRGKIQTSYICETRKNLIFELDALQHLVAGTPVAFDDGLHLTEKTVAGQLDNIITVAALIYLFDLGFQGTAFFTAQEEAGKSWRYLLQWFQRFGGKSNELICVDTSPFPTAEAAAEQHLVLRHRDANATFCPKLTQKLVSLCHSKGYTYCFKDEIVEAKNKELEAQGLPARSLGATEMGRIIDNADGLVTGTTLQIPSWGYHTMEETAYHQSVECFLEVLSSLSEGG